MSFMDFFRIKERTKSRLREAIKGYELLNPKKFNSVYSSDMSILQIYVSVDNIIDYIKLIEEIIFSLQTDNQLNKHTIPFTAKLIYLRDFFLDNNKFYINTEIISKEFIDKSIELLTLYELKEKDINKSFTTGKNLLLTQNIVNNIIEIQGELTNVFRQ